MTETDNRMASEFKIPVPRMTDNIAVWGSYVYLSAGMKRYYVYNVKEPIMGRGGMGEVYRGYDCRTGELVAIKRLYDKYCSIPSIRRKARVESGLVFSHPNIVEMLGYSEYRCGRGPIFVISRFVPGLNSDKFIEQNTAIFDCPERAHKIVRMLLPLLDALEFLHRQYIYHLDIKPSNIMVDKFSTARLMDLGIANTTMDTAGFGKDEFGVLGTPRFASPEQFQVPGRKSTIGRTSDLYELAVTIYELITRNNPFQGDSIKDIAYKHFNGYLPAHDDIPDRLLRVLQKASEPNPADRYPNALAFKEALVEAMIPKKRRWPF